MKVTLRIPAQDEDVSPISSIARSMGWTVDNQDPSGLSAHVYAEDGFHAAMEVCWLERRIAQSQRVAGRYLLIPDELEGWD